MEEYRAMRETILKAVQEKMQGTQEEIEEVAKTVTDAVMDAIAENYRSLTEIHSIVAAVRAGERVQIAYADPDDLDFMNPYVVKACW